MVAHLVRLKLALLRNGLRRSPWQLVAMVLGGLYGLGAVAFAASGLAWVAATGSAELTRDATVLAGSLLVAGWLVVPVVFFSADATLDPARFATFPVPRHRLVAGLWVAGLVGVPGAATVLMVLGSTLVWGAVLPTVVGLVAGSLAVAFALAGSRATTTVLAGALGGRRSREVAGLATVAAVAAAYLVIGRAPAGGMDPRRLESVVPDVVRVLGWTPLGAAWHAPADVAAGEWGTGLARVGVLVVSVLLAVAAWDRALVRALVRPLHRAGGHTSRGPGAFARVPARPTGAVAARALTYWRRDPRYATSVVAVPLLPLALWALGAGDLILASAPFLAAMLGWSLATDTSSDGTALWLHVATPLEGRADRLGRVLAAVTVLGPVVALLSLALAGITGRLADLPAVLGAALGAFFTSLAAASVMSALVVMRVQQAGENPFGTRQGTPVATVLLQVAGFAVVALLAVPELVLGLVAVLRGSAALGWLTLAVGPLLGSWLIVLGVRWGGRLLDRRGAVLLQRLVALG